MVDSCAEVTGPGGHSACRPFTSMELEEILEAIHDLMKAAGWMTKDGGYDYSAFRNAMGVDIGYKKDVGRITLHSAALPGAGGKGFRHNGKAELWLDMADLREGKSRTFFKSQVVHELAHIWDDSWGRALSKGMAPYSALCGCAASQYAGEQERGGTTVTRDYDSAERWAEAVAAMVYPGLPRYSDSKYLGAANIGKTILAPYVERQFDRFRSR